MTLISLTSVLVCYPFSCSNNRYANAVEVPLPIDAATEAQAAQADRDAAIHKAWHASVASLGASSTSGTPTSTMPTTAAATTASTGAAVLRPTAISSSAAGTGAAAYGLSSTTPSSGGGEASHPNHPCHPTRSTRPGALPDPQLDVERSLALWAWEAALPKALSQRSAAISSSSGGGAFSMHYTRFDADPSKVLNVAAVLAPSCVYFSVSIIGAEYYVFV